MRVLLLSLLLASCTNVTMTSGKGVAVSCDIYPAAPAKLSCTDTEGKSFVWESEQAFVLKGICRPCADGTCPVCQAKP